MKKPIIISPFSVTDFFYFYPNTDKNLFLYLRDTYTSTLALISDNITTNIYCIIEFNGNTFFEINAIIFINHGWIK